jgi:hypothetical protein
LRNLDEQPRRRALNLESIFSDGDSRISKNPHIFTACALAEGARLDAGACAAALFD